MNEIFVALFSYNRPEGVIERIEEIRGQIYNNWQLYIFDDFSERDNLEKICDYIERINDTKIHLIKNEENQGLVNQLNKAISLFLETPNFSFFTWISDDNFYLPTFLNFLTIPIYNNLDVNEDLSQKKIFSYSGYEYMEYKQNKLIKHKKILKRYWSFRDLYEKFFGLSCFMWSKALMREIGYYSKEYETVEDLEYLYRTFLVTKEEDRFYSNSVGCIYINHSDNISQKKKDIVNEKSVLLRKSYEEYFFLNKNNNK